MALAVNNTDQSLVKICGGCNQVPSGDLLKACGKCKSAYYCSVACQRKAWPEHKKSCGSLSVKSVVPFPVFEAKTALPEFESHMTGYLRFMNISLDVLKSGLLGSNKEIWIPGPGLYEINGKSHCPQLEESLQLWDHSHFTVLDSNPKVLDALRTMGHQLPIPYVKNVFAMNQKSIEHLPELNKVMSRLTDEAPRQNCVTIKNFRMGIDNPKDLPQADVIIGTYSLYYPMLEILNTNTDQNRDRRFSLFGQFMSKLKVGGVLYIDQDCLGHILAKNAEDFDSSEKIVALYGRDSIRTLVDYLNSYHKIPVNCHFLESVLGEDLTEKDLTRGERTWRRYVVQHIDDKRMQRVQTKDVFAFERIAPSTGSP